MFRMILIALTAALIVVPGRSAPAAEASAKDAAIKELLTAMNTMDNMEKSLNILKEKIKTNAPYILQEVKVILGRRVDTNEVDRAADMFTKEDFGSTRLYELIRDKLSMEKIENDVMLPIYRAHYSTAEIQELTAFYQSELGQKTLKLTPVISQSISTKTRDISQLALNQAKEELAVELQNKLEQ
ncbi:MAG: DUF2059 domain-containing protein [Desulfopila sp.]